MGLEPATKGHTDSQIKIELATRNSHTRNSETTRPLAPAALAALGLGLYIYVSRVWDREGGRASAYRRQHGAQGRGRWVAFIQLYAYSLTVVVEE